MNRTRDGPRAVAIVAALHIRGVPLGERNLTRAIVRQLGLVAGRFEVAWPL